MGPTSTMRVSRRCFNLADYSSRKIGVIGDFNQVILKKTCWGGEITGFFPPNVNLVQSLHDLSKTISKPFHRLLNLARLGATFWMKK